MSETKMFELYVEKEYLDVMPRPTAQQYIDIKESIKKDGQLEEIICNEKGAIRDGHTRFQICKELGIKPKYKVRKFSNEEEEKLFAVTVNLKRRHLTLMQRYELVEPFKEKIREQVKQTGIELKRNGYDGIPANSKETNRTAKKVGELLDVSMATVYQLDTVKKHASENTLNSVRTGKIPLWQGFIKTREERYKKKDPIIVKHANARRNGLLVKRLKKFHDSRIGLAINVLRKLTEGEFLITYVALACNSRLRKYDEVSAIADRFVKYGYVSERLVKGKRYLSITNNGKKLFKKLVVFERLIETNNMSDWL